MNLARFQQAIRFVLSAVVCLAALFPAASLWSRSLSTQTPLRECVLSFGKWPFGIMNRCKNDIVVIGPYKWFLDFHGFPVVLTLLCLSTLVCVVIGFILSAGLYRRSSLHLCSNERIA